jgi:trk system potassium uptake protein TrkH
MRLRLANMELSSLSRDDYKSRANKTVYIFAYVYLIMVAASFLSYLAAGMNWFDAICHSFSVSASGGFSSRNLSIASFNSPVIAIITIVFMFLTSLHFGLLFVTFASRSLKPLKNPIIRFYVISIVVISIITSLSLKLSHVDTSWGKAFLDGTFHVVSYASTTGFGLSDNSVWPMLPCFMLILVSIFCGCAGSTTGGLKVDRAVVLFKAIRMQIQKTLNPSTIYEMRLGKRILHDEEIYPHLLYIAMFVMLVGLSAILCMLFGDPNGHALTGSLASLANVGPSIGTIGSMGNYNAEPGVIKFIFTADMFLGRVEIYPVLAVFSSIFRRQ